MIKAIDTFYNGNYFRARLEARWAVFFNECGIKYIYEPEGFVLENGQWYLPDFYLPQLDCYVEVKPFSGGTLKDADVKSHLDYKLKWVPFSHEKMLALLFGVPHANAFPVLGDPMYKEQVDEEFPFCWNEFYKDCYGLRFWVQSGTDSDKGYLKEDAVLKANCKRFEHNQV